MNVPLPHGVPMRVRSPNTVRAYRSDWDDFTAWAAALDAVHLPASPQTVIAYVEALAALGRKPATIQRRLSAISHHHAEAGLESPAKHPDVRKAAREAAAAAETRVTTPLHISELLSIVTGLPDSAHGVRDRALLLLGFAGALQRREIVGLDAEDVEEHGHGLRLRIRRPDADGDDQGRTVDIPYGVNPLTCPVRALRAWLDRAEIVSGPLFRGVSRAGRPHARRLSDKSVVLVLKRAALAAGLDPARYAAHSLRAGLAVAAAAAGASERSIMAQTGHRSVAMVRRYAVLGLGLENAAALAGL